MLREDSSEAFVKEHGGVPEGANSNRSLQSDDLLTDGKPY